MAKPPRKVRVDFRKNRQVRARRSDWTRQFQNETLENTAPSRETIQAKGEGSRRRTIMVDTDESGATTPALAANVEWHTGRIIAVAGNFATVERSDAAVFNCAVSRVLRTIAIESRSTVAAGDRVQFRLVEGAISGPDIREPQGMIERVEPRKGVLARGYRGKEQIIAANVDHLLIVSALAEPGLKPNLVDRYIVIAEKGGIRPVICLNKADLVELDPLEEFIDVYRRIGYDVLVTSATTGLGIDRLRELLTDRETVIAGQSGVGKSSLLNAIEPGLNLRVSDVSHATLHGKHTTTIARLYRLSFGGWVVDTPGIRQLELWDIIPAELEGYFLDFHPFVPNCRFPDCSHTHETDCAVKAAVERGDIDAGRYERYLNLFAGDAAGASKAE